MGLLMYYSGIDPKQTRSRTHRFVLPAILLSTLTICVTGVQAQDSTSQTATETNSQKSVATNERPPLVAAARDANWNEVKRLISQGADVNAKPGEDSALLYASVNGNLEIVK